VLLTWNVIVWDAGLSVTVWVQVSLLYHAVGIYLNCTNQSWASSHDHLARGGNKQCYLLGMQLCGMQGSCHIVKKSPWFQHVTVSWVQVSLLYHAVGIYLNCTNQSWASSH